MVLIPPPGSRTQLVVVTGANGFVGRALCEHFAAEGRPHRRIVRTLKEHVPGAESIALGDLDATPESDLAAAFDGAYAVVHLAGQAHLMRRIEAASDAALFTAANTVATERVATAAARVGVQRIILASTVKVLGERSAPERPLRADDAAAPEDVYGRSKADAERALLAVCSRSALAPILLRLPLTYGPRVKGNFLALMDAVARRAPLPFGAIDNRRHLLYVGNLAHIISRLLDAEPAPVGAWMIADSEALSTPELVRRIAKGLGVSPRIVSVPVSLLRMAGLLTRRTATISRLTDSLEVDARPLQQRVGAPPFTVDEGLAATAAWWRGRHAI